MLRFVLLPFLLLVLVGWSTAFQPIQSRSIQKTNSRNPAFVGSALFAGQDDKRRKGVGSSGYRRERLEKLAELEDSRVETDKGFVLQAAGGFVAFIIVILAAAFFSGLLTQY
jgi:hypothetical protein